MKMNHKEIIAAARAAYEEARNAQDDAAGKFVAAKRAKERADEEVVAAKAKIHAAIDAAKADEA